MPLQTRTLRVLAEGTLSSLNVRPSGSVASGATRTMTKSPGRMPEIANVRSTQWLAAMELNETAPPPDVAFLAKPEESMPSNFSASGALAVLCTVPSGYLIPPSVELGEFWVSMRPTTVSFDVGRNVPTPTLPSLDPFGGGTYLIYGIADLVETVTSPGRRSFSSAHRFGASPLRLAKRPRLVSFRYAGRSIHS